MNGSQESPAQPTQSRRRLTEDEKLDVIRKAWGYVEVVQATLIQGWKVWLVKNYSGRILDEIYWNGNGLPGNPTATKKIEYTGHTRDKAIQRAYAKMKGKKR